MRKWLLSSAIALQCFSLNAANNCCDDFCSDLHVEASWLYWQVGSDNFNFLNIREFDDTANVFAEKDSTQKMPWDSGFRLGIGMDLPCLGIDVKAIWSDFRSSGTKKTTINQPSVLNNSIGVLWPFSADGITMTTAQTSNAILDFTAKQKISFDFDTVNLEFGKWISFDCINIAFRPHVGLQYLQYQDHRKFQRISNVVNQTPLIGEYSFKQRFQGFGVRGGFDVGLPLFCNISLVGNLAASLDWGRNKFSYNTNVSGGNPAADGSGHAKKSEHNSQALIDLGIGLRWETCICDGYGLTLEALYEQHQLLEGSRLWTNNGLNTSSPANNPDHKGNLTMQGLSLTAGLTF